MNIPKPDKSKRVVPDSFFTPVDVSGLSHEELLIRYNTDMANIAQSLLWLVQEVKKSQTP